MGRIECEKAIIQKMREIMDIYHEYNPDGEYLSMTIVNDHFSVNNIYFEDDYEHQIQAWVEDSYEDVYSNNYVRVAEDRKDKELVGA